MPYSPGQLTFDSDGPTRVERERERKRMFDRGRGTAAERGYDSRWQKARIGFLAKHPLCAECEKAGAIVPATVVDHIVPHRGDKVLFWMRSNWQPLCKAHHDAKTAREDSAFAGGGGSITL